MAVKYTNNAKSTLASGINSSVTSATVADGSVFPSLGAGEYFYITFDDGSNNEIAKVTARSGNTLTIVRAQDNTTARAFSTGDSAELRVIAAVLTEIQENIAAKSANQTVYSATAASNATAYNIGVDPGVEANASVFLDGVYQHHDTFSFSGSTLTFDAAPTNGTKIEVVVDNLVNLQSSNLTVDTFTATSGQTAFTLSDAPGGESNVLAFIDGVFQNQASFTLSSNTLTFDTGVVVGRSVTVYTINPVNIGTPSDSTVTSAKLTGNITLPGSLTVGAYDVAFDSPTFVVDHSNSRVGLGTASPSVPVDIVGEAKISSHFTILDAGSLKVGTGADVVLSSDGTHGTIAAANGNLTLDVAGDIILDVAGSDVIYKRSGTSVGEIQIGDDNFNIRSLVSNKDIIFKGNDNGSTISALTLDMSEAGAAIFAGEIVANKALRLRTTDDQAQQWYVYTHTDDTFRINYNGAGSDVLVIDTNEDSTFNGEVTINGGSDANLNLKSASSRSGAFIMKPGTSTVMGSVLVLADESYRLGTASNYHLQMNQSGTTVINADGANVGIGTASPAAKLDITGDTSTWAGMSKIYFTDVNSNTSSRNWSIGNGGTAFGSLSFIVSNAADGVPADTTGSAVMSMDGVNQRVGINVNAPSKTLSVRAANAIISAESTADSQRIGFQAKYIEHGSLYGSFEYTTGDAQLWIDNNFTGNNGLYSNIRFRNKENGGSTLVDRMIIAGSTGNVGIGNIEASHKLHVEANGTGAISALRLANENTSVGDGAKLLFTSGTSTTGAGIAGYGTALNAADLVFYAGGDNERMRIHDNGRDFDFKSDTVAGYTPNLNLYSMTTGAYSPQIHFYTRHVTGGGDYQWPAASIFTSGASGYSSGALSGYFRVYIRGKFGESAAINALDINSSGLVSGDLNDTSDVALKKDITTLNASDSLTAIKALNPVTFKWKADDRETSGFIAQEVEKHLPNDVIGEDWRAEDPDLEKNDIGSKGKAVNTVGILAHAVKVIQELEARIKVLEDK